MDFQRIRAAEMDIREIRILRMKRYGAVKQQSLQRELAINACDNDGPMLRRPGLIDDEDIIRVDSGSGHAVASGSESIH